jgi:hypothetical protein
MKDKIRTMSNNIQIYNHQWENNKITKENDNEEYLESINYMREKKNIYENETKFSASFTNKSYQYIVHI